MKEFLQQVIESKQFKCDCSAQRVKMATLKIRMVIGLIALLIGGLSLNAVAQSNYPVVKKTHLRTPSSFTTAMSWSERRW